MFVPNLVVLGGHLPTSESSSDGMRRPVLRQDQWYLSHPGNHSSKLRVRERPRSRSDALEDDYFPKKYFSPPQSPKTEHGTESIT
ncbi:hypothetical protein AVEN_61898-1 [Araneus ventricosus]|uniref:Uncharacterized protein n=1 Tax=Araneus ventricosus TaxID=182803 RepID=A0A4Y2MVM8_ARAVE|nr:hypothetical protein AVEN_61898-1 [Araneus ventricosus]